MPVYGLNIWKNIKKNRKQKLLDTTATNIKTILGDFSAGVGNIGYNTKWQAWIQEDLNPWQWNEQFTQKKHN